MHLERLIVRAGVPVFRASSTGDLPIELSL